MPTARAARLSRLPPMPAVRRERRTGRSRRKAAAYSSKSSITSENRMDLDLTGKTALITGGSKGIGRAVAEAFLREGMSVTLIARDAGSLETARAELDAIAP